MADSGRVVYLNGEFVPEKEARISIYDSALMFGDMVFEMTRSFNRVHFRLKEHLDRMWAGIRILRIPLKMTQAEMMAVIDETTRRNVAVFDDDEEVRLLINVSRGPLPLYREIFDGRLEPTVTVSAFPLSWIVGDSAHLYDTGAYLYVTSQRAIPADLMDPKIKNRSRLFYMMANLEVAERGPKAFALLLDPDGFVAEGTGSNFFIVKDGAVLTPEGRNVLRGVGRQYIKELAQELGIPFREANIELYDAKLADEAFLTTTPHCIIPATKINDVEIGDGKTGPVTQALLEQWGKNVGIEIVRQILHYATKVQRNSRLLSHVIEGSMASGAFVTESARPS